MPKPTDDRRVGGNEGQPEGAASHTAAKPRLDELNEEGRGTSGAAGQAPSMMGSAPNIEPPHIEIGEVWGRRRIFFLLASAFVVLVVIWATREVVLPFV